MMRGPRQMAVAVRRPAGDVLVDLKPVGSITERFTFLKWPLLRGVVALVESLVIGIQALTFSANQQTEEEEEALSGGEIALTILLAFGLAALLFIVVPTAAAHYLQKYMNNFWQNMAEGGVRIAVFLVYVMLISRIRDIQRVFQYHGAEHKVIHAYEAGEPLTVANAQKYGSLHPRCGTAFLLIVMVLTILVYSLLHTPGLLWRIGSRLLLLPVVAGLGYEALKLSSRYTHVGWVRVLIAPGLWLQKLTTREPDDTQVEVAIKALEAVLVTSDAA
ncbi:membrane protein [Clostridiales bacterium PH28_bin88]|nr:membrane protein [Clostridiales bacterium PH28_bin88]